MNSIAFYESQDQPPPYPIPRAVATMVLTGPGRCRPGPLQLAVCHGNYTREKAKPKQPNLAGSYYD